MLSFHVNKYFMPEKTIEYEAIGTHWWISVKDEISQEKWDSLSSQIRSIMLEFDNNYSRFKSASYIGILNEKKVLTNFPSVLFGMMNFAEQVRNVSQGYFDIAVGTHLENLGYDKNLTFTEKDKKINIENRFKILTPEKIEIYSEIKIDLGGIGKGWLIDEAKNILIQNEIHNFTINGGGDIYFASTNGRKEKFALENPFDQTQMIGTIEIENKSIACSAGTKRNWETANSHKAFNHLVSAKTGENISDIAAVFTQGDNALSADTASTAIFVSPTNIADKIAMALHAQYLIIFSTGQYLKSFGYEGSLFH